MCYFRITELLGSGQFGTVNKGIWQSPAGAVEVAVKTLQSSASQEDRVKFLQEAAINGQFRHPNVVNLLGVVTVGEPVSINSPLCLFVLLELHALTQAARSYALLSSATSLLHQQLCHPPLPISKSFLCMHFQRVW